MKRPSGGSGCTCSDEGTGRATKNKDLPGGVKVLEEKLVAGFQASVLETKSTKDLVAWLEKNGYAFSPPSRRGPSPTSRTAGRSPR